MLSVIRGIQFPGAIERAHTLLLSAILLIIFSMTVSSLYVDERSRLVFLISNIIELLCTAALSFLIPEFTLQFFSFVQKKLLFRIFRILSCVQAAGVVLFFSAFPFEWILNTVVIIFTAVTAASVILLIAVPVSMKDVSWLKFRRLLVLGSVIFFPPIIISDLLLIPGRFDSRLYNLKATPFFLLYWSSVYFKIMLPGFLSGLRAENKEPDWSRFHLSVREREVAELLIQGLSYRTIGDRLFISPGTVKTHVLVIYRKTGTNSKIQLSNAVYNN